MTNCQSVPCPAFHEVELNIDGICDCQDYTTPGNPDCVIHGLQVRAWIDGFAAARKVFAAAYRNVYETLDYYGAAK